MKLSRFFPERLAHDSVAGVRRQLGWMPPRVEHPDPAQGQQMEIAQEAGQLEIDNSPAHRWVGDEPVTRFDWPEAGVWRLHGVQVTGEVGHIFTRTGLWGLSARDERGRVGKIRPPIDCLARRIREPIVHLCGPNAENRGHFMMDILPRLEAWLHSKYSDQARLFLVPARHLGWQSRLLEAYGIMPEQLIPQGPGTTLVDELWFVPKLNGLDKLAAPHWYQLIRQRFLPHENQPPRSDHALLVSRATAPDKRILNESEVIEVVKTYYPSLKVTELAGIPLSQQAEMFAQAGSILGGYGQGLVNLLFASASTVIVFDAIPALKRPSWARAFQQLAQIFGNTAICLPGRGGVKPNENYPVNLDALKKLLQRIRGNSE